MKKTIKNLTILLAFIATFTVFAVPAKLTKVTLENTDKFTDFKISNRNSKKEAERLVKDLKNQIQKSINKNLPNNQSMHINISDVDMAGMISPMHDIREIRDSLEKSVLEFDFTLYDENGKTIKQDKVVLVEKFVDTKSLKLNRYRNTYFKYEMVMFSKWLKKTFKTM